MVPDFLEKLERTSKGILCFCANSTARVCMTLDPLLASSGSKVMQTRAVEFAQKHNIPFEVRSSFSKKSGTMVKKKVKSLEDMLVS